MTIYRYIELNKKLRKSTHRQPYKILCICPNGIILYIRSNTVVRHWLLISEQTKVVLSSVNLFYSMVYWFTLIMPLPKVIKWFFLKERGWFFNVVLLIYRSYFFSITENGLYSNQNLWKIRDYNITYIK